MDVSIAVKRRGRPPKMKVESLQVDMGTQGFMRFQAMRLEGAMALRAGVMDSDSKHLEIANNIRSIVMSVIDDLRAKANG